MKALVFSAIKQPFEYRDIDLPEYEGDQFVTVDLKAAALNRRDYWISIGMYPGIDNNLPTVLGSDGCGLYNGEAYIISPNIRWGEGPFPSRDYLILGLEEYGTFAEQIRARKASLQKKPDHLTFEQAAALPLAGLTAYRALFTRSQAKAGENVLISGIGGGVALLAFQFALAAGANVYVTSSSEDKIEKAREMGALGGANYKDPASMKALAKSCGGFDVVIDSAGGDGFNQLLKMCRMGARVTIYGGTAGPINGLSVPNLFFKQISIHGSTMGSDQEFANMVRFVSQHKIVPVVDEVFDLKDGNLAMQKMEESRQFGKIVLKI